MTNHRGLALVAVGLALCCPGGARPAPSARELALLRRVRGGGRLGGFPGAVGAFGRAVGDGIKEETSGGNSINDEDGVPPKSGGGSGAGAGHVTESHSSTRSHSSRTSRLDNVSGDGAVASEDLVEAAPADSEAADLGDDGPVSLEMVEDAYQSISPENQAELLRLAAQSVQDGFNQLPAEDRNSLKGYVFDRVPESTRADVLDLLQRVKHAEERQAARDAEAAAARDEQEREERGGGGGGGSAAAAQQYGSAAPASEAEMQAVMATYQMPPEVTAALVRRHLLNTLLVNVPYVLLTNMFAAVGSMAGLALVRRFIAGGSVQQAKKRGQEKRVTFKDVVGCDEAKEEVRQVVDFLQSPEKYAKLGATVPRGILLCGPPGTGKTLLAKACAGEAGVPFLYSCGSDYNGMYAGQGVALVKQQFAAARKHKKAIIFIDELDYVGKRRSSGTNGQQSLALDRESTLTQLLAEMDGFSPNDGIVVIATTNRGDMLDPALLRSGRFGTSVEVEAPDRLGRQQLFARYLAAMSVTPDADTLSAIANAAATAAATGTGSGADQTTAAAAAGALTAANALATLTTAATAAAPAPTSTAAAADRSVRRSAARRLPLQLLRVGGRIALVVLGAPLAPLAMHHLALRRRAAAAQRAAAAAAAEAAGAAAGGADGAPSAEAVRWAMAGELAGLTPGFVGADIEQVCNVAAMAAAKAGSDAISRGDLSNAIDRVWNGLEKRSKLVKPHERQRTAIHEAGHAVVGWRLPHADVVNKVSIVWRGSALGFTQSLPDERLNSLRGHYLDKVCVCLGGRAAEALCLGDVSDGASSDLSTATRIIKEMIMRLGFGSSIGLFAPSDWSALSELTAQKIEQEIQTILEEQYERAKALVAANMEPLRALERLLLEQEVVHEAGLKALLGEKATPDDNNTSTAAATLLPGPSTSAPDAGAAPSKAAPAPATAEPAEEELAGLAVLAMRSGAGRREL